MDSYANSVCESVIVDVLNEMNDSKEFLHTFDESTFSHLENGNVSVSIDEDVNEAHNDDDYVPDDDDASSSSSSSSSDDDVPLIHLINNRKTKPATNVTLNTTDEGKHKSRKRTKNTDLWKRNVLKRRRNQGLEYKTEKGELKRARIIKAGCGPTCRYKCHELFSDSDRQKIFHWFWNLSDINKQRNFIAKFAVQQIKKQGSSLRRKHSVSYSFPTPGQTTGLCSRKVCKTFFLDTLSVSERYVTTTHSKLNYGIVADDNRGTHLNRPHKTSSEQLDFVRAHIESFPTMESHYCRKDSQKEYLSPDLNVSKMYALYKEACQEKSITHVSLPIYRKVFNNEYNISFHRPIKDQCDICVAYKNSLPEQRVSMKTTYTNHIENKLLACESKEKDKNETKKKQFTSVCLL